MCQFYGILDGSISQPTSHGPHGTSQQNPIYNCWFWVDQLNQAWLFGTISKDTLSEVRDLMHSIQVWQHLESKFNMASLAQALDIEYLLTNISLEPDQFVDSYSCSIKTIADTLAAIQLPIYDIELI